MNYPQQQSKRMQQHQQHHPNNNNNKYLNGENVIGDDDEHDSFLIKKDEKKAQHHHQQHQPPSTQKDSYDYENCISSNEFQPLVVQQQHSQQILYFYYFICFCTALRSFEAGIVSSRMSDIQLDLSLDYIQEGTITASPDFGIAPGALLSIYIFRAVKNQEYIILMTILWGAAIVAIGCALYPTYYTLLAARAIGGFCWAQAAVHFPVWIDRRAPPTNKTIWLACTNVSILIGVIFGYLVGGACQYFKLTFISSWISLYGLAGLLMLLCVIILWIGFDPTVVRVKDDDSSQDQEQQKLLQQHPPISSSTATSVIDYGSSSSSYQHNNNGINVISTSASSSISSCINNHGHEENNANQIVIHNGQENNVNKDNNENDNTSDLTQVLQHLFQSIPFILAVAITGCISGGIVFALYFAAQVAEARGISSHTTLILVITVFLTAPAPGLMLGSWIVHKCDGGYSNHIGTFAMSLGSAIVVFLSACAMPWTYYMFPPASDLEGDNNNNFVSSMAFFLSFWMFAFAGAMAGPPMNGIAVSAVPHATHVASAIQFAIANAAKIVVPQLGGILCEHLGLIEGFHMTLVLTSLVFVIISFLGLIHAYKDRKQQQQQDSQERVGASVAAPSTNKQQP